MMDLEQALATVLQDGWKKSNAPMPAFYYEDSVRSHDLRTPCIKVYMVDEGRKPRGIGYTSEDRDARLTVDIRGAQRETVALIVDEVVRILGAKRKNPIAGYELMTKDGVVKQSGYAGFWHYTIDVHIFKYGGNL